MNFVLVDDEMRTLQGLRAMIETNWPQYSVVYCALDGESALAYIGENPVDVLITDIQMPGMNGTDLIIRVHEQFPAISIIALSAYSDFSYVRRALLHGALDYLLKPCDLENLRAVLDQALSKAQHKKNSESTAGLARYRALSGHIDPPAELGEPFLVSALRLSNSTDEERRQSIARDVLAILGTHSIVLPQNGYLLIVTPGAKPGEGLFERLKSCVAFQNRANSRQVLLSVSHAITPAELFPCERSCVDMLRFLGFNQIGAFLYYDNYVRLTSSQRTFYIDDYFDIPRMVHMVIGLEQNALEAYIRKTWEEILSRYAVFLPEVIKAHVTKLLLEMEAVVGQYFSEVRIMVPEGWLSLPSLVESATNMSQLENRFIQLALSFNLNNARGPKLPQYVLDAIRYIDENYARPITLHEIAQNVYINNWYLSAQFSKYMKLSLNEYINKVRINHAMQLLKSGNMRIYQVSSEVGFSDPAYFSAVFRRFTGVTPKEYQKNIGHITME